MNIKLHTPKSLKTGSGMATTKQFMLSLLATTVSIVLTFGTAAVIDNNKKQNEKREIVMMVMYDMYNSLKSAEVADSNIHQLMNFQLQMAEDTTMYEKLKFQFVQLLPNYTYTETTERIFSSNIETINTIGNVIFTENVAKFYQNRKYYKEIVCDSINHISSNELSRFNLKNTLQLELMPFGLISGSILYDMQHLFALCKQMMDVTDDEIDAYRRERVHLEETLTNKNESVDQLNKEIFQLQSKIDYSIEKLK